MSSRKHLIRKILTMAVAGAATAGMSVVGLGATAAHADSSQPVTFSVTSGGALTLAQDNTGSTTLVDGVSVNMPQTTVADSRNDSLRDGAWSVTATPSALTNGNVAQDIPGGAIALAQRGSFGTNDSGTVSGATGSFTASGDSINSVYTYTPTATLTVPVNQFSGDYTGFIDQTAT